MLKEAEQGTRPICHNFPMYGRYRPKVAVASGRSAERSHELYTSIRRVRKTIHRGVR
jgi:hypothetical protein